jgi:hypothetical protein
MVVKILFCLASVFKGLHVHIISTYWLEACTLDRPSVLKFTEEDLFGYVRLKEDLFGYVRLKEDLFGYVRLKEDLFGYVRLKRIYLTLSGDLTFQCKLAYLNMEVAFN